jgi:hypothetical protein
MSERKHIAEHLTDVLELERIVREMADKKDLTIVRLALNDEMGRAVEALRACWAGMDRLRSIVEQMKLEKPK